METADTITLEFLRTGGPDNQLISTLTPYLAVCENQEPRTVHLPFDHHEYLLRQERLRYEIRSDGGSADPEKIEAELLEMGRKISGLIGSVPGVAASFGSGASADGLIQLELVFSALELSLVPFEATISPDGCPGPGQALSLQTERPVAITRRQRNSVNSRIRWRREPQVLVAFSAAGGDIPVGATLTAIRAAIEPWIKPMGDGDDREKHIKVLSNMSLESLRQACSENDFSHVHILAHGGSRKIMGGERFGLVVDGRGGKGRDIVSGSDLAAAIRTLNKSKGELSAPVCVTVAACDSGGVGTVIPPGGSVAQELHQSGIPFVIGSQFPLSTTGAVVVAETLYPGLLKGDDPRVVLHEVRKRLKLLRGYHDWASIVAYLAEIPTLKDDLMRQKIEQARRAGKAAAAWAKWSADKEMEATPELHAKFAQAMEWLEKSAPESDHMDPEARGARGEVLGLRGSLLKQRADIIRKVGEKADKAARAKAEDIDSKDVKDANDTAPQDRSSPAAEGKSWRDREKELLGEARKEYMRGAEVGSFGTVVEDWGNIHWLATQYMSLTLFLTGSLDDERWFPIAQGSCEADVREKNSTFRAWAFSTRTELALLSVFSNDPDRKKTAWSKAIAAAKDYVKEAKNPFQIHSTRRQFERYRGWLKDYLEEYGKAAERETANKILDDILAIFDGKETRGPLDQQTRSPSAPASSTASENSEAQLPETTTPPTTPESSPTP